MHRAIALLAGVLTFSLTGCETARLPIEQGVGPRPTLPEPNQSVMPTVKIAPAKGWLAGVIPQAAAGFAVSAYANGLDHPRWLHVLPNGDVLVAETNAPQGLKTAKALRAGL